jgi:hypothetical protein
MHQGNRDFPITYKGQNLYFRGAVNTRAHLKWINQTFPLFRLSTHVVLAGSSTGGTASILWATYIKSLFPNTTNFFLISDSVMPSIQIKNINASFINILMYLFKLLR